MRQVVVSLYTFQDLSYDHQRMICEGERKRIRAKDVVNLHAQTEQFKRVLDLFGCRLDLSPANQPMVFFSIEHNRHEDGAAFWGRWNLQDVKLTEIITFQNATQSRIIGEARKCLNELLVDLSHNRIAIASARINSHTQKFKVNLHDLVLKQLSGAEVENQQALDSFNTHLSKVITWLNHYFHRLLRNDFDNVTSYESIGEKFRKSGAEFLGDGTPWIWGGLK